MVCPVIDVIDWNTFQYLGNPGEPQIGGFDWRLVFTWHTVPDYEQKRRSSPTDVIRYVAHLGQGPGWGWHHYIAFSSSQVNISH